MLATLISWMCSQEEILPLLCDVKTEWEVGDVVHYHTEKTRLRSKEWKCGSGLLWVLPLLPGVPTALLRAEGASATITAVTHSLLEKVVDQEGGSLQQVCSLRGDGVSFVSHLGRLLL